MIQLLFDGPGNAEHDMIQYIDALNRAATKYQERDAERKGVWKRGGVKGQVRDAYAKAERLFFESHHHNDLPSEDDLIDLINYAAFALMLIRVGQDTHFDVEPDVAKLRILNGAWPW